jgi:hypothetical protein
LRDPALQTTGAPVRPAIGEGGRLLGCGLSLPDAAAIIYLALPVVLFFLTWFRLGVGIPLALAAIAGLPLLRGVKPGRLSRFAFIFALLLALAWASLSGASHFFYAGQALNWPIRDAVMRDLVLLDHPVIYGANTDSAMILRAPIAYYMVPALLGRLVGVQHAFLLLYLWTALGVAIFLMQVLEGAPTVTRLLLSAAVVMLFSGMDLLAPQEMIADPASHGAWQAFFYQSTYNANLLIGFPNHGIPGWLATALLYRCRDDPKFVGLAAWLGALTLLWAPLVSIGLLPFFAALAWRHWKLGTVRSLFSWPNLAAAPLLTIASALYLMLGSGTLATTGTTPSPLAPDWQAFLPVYIQFTALEFGALAAALAIAYRGAIEPVYFTIAILSLLLLPWFHFGPNNDLVTRGSIPALTMLMLMVLDGWARPLRIGGRGIVVAAILLVGAVLPIARMGQVLSQPAWRPDLQHSLYEVTQGRSPNYLADLAEGSLLGRLLKDARPPVK